MPGLTAVFAFSPGDRVVIDGHTIATVVTVGRDESGVNLVWYRIHGHVSASPIPESRLVLAPPEAALPPSEPSPG